MFAQLAAFSVGLYLAGMVLEHFRTDAGHWARLVCGCALLCHAAMLSAKALQLGAPDFSLFGSFSTLALLMAPVVVLPGLEPPMRRKLALVLIPVTIVAVSLHALWPGRELDDVLSRAVVTHAFFAFIAYAFLGLGATFALLAAMVDRALRARQPSAVLDRLPSLDVCELLMFRSIGTGFVLLTVALIAGALTINDFFGQHLAHKTVLSVLAWLLFGTLLIGRQIWGWRGRQAVQLSIFGMSALALAFLGSKLVLEVILGNN